jgi:hypothetical protein
MSTRWFASAIATIRLEALRDTEVEQVSMMSGNEDVRRFQVAVHHTGRVRVRQRPGHVPQQGHCLVERKRGRLPQSFAE